MWLDSPLLLYSSDYELKTIRNYFHHISLSIGAVVVKYANSVLFAASAADVGWVDEMAKNAVHSSEFFEV